MFCLSSKRAQVVVDEPAAAHAHDASLLQKRILLNRERVLIATDAHLRPLSSVRHAITTGVGLLMLLFAAAAWKLPQIHGPVRERNLDAELVEFGLDAPQKLPFDVPLLERLRLDRKLDDRAG